MKISVVKNSGQAFEKPVNIRYLVALHRIIIFA